MLEVIKINISSVGLRIDRWIKNNLIKIPQSLIEKDLRNGKIKVNKKKVKSSYKLNKDDKIYLHNINYKTLTISKKKIIPEKIIINDTEKDIIENNSDFIVINKKSGLPVQGGTKVKENLINILSNSFHFKSLKPYIVHRIDKDTSGILIIAKNRETAQQLTTLFRIRKIHKTYLAVVKGEVPKNLKKMEDFLEYFEKNKKTRLKATTFLKVLKSNNKYSLLELNPLTGRKHQLRKQLYMRGFPIIGDTKYHLGENKKIKSQLMLLHSYKIKFMRNNKKFNYLADLDREFKKKIDLYFR